MKASVPPMPKGINVLVRSCARCTGDHEMVFQAFTFSMKFLWRTWTHWGVCPNVKEPVLMFVSRRWWDLRTWKP